MEKWIKFFVKICESLTGASGNQKEMKPCPVYVRNRK